MQLSEARITANRQNSLKSTGPKEGKVRSRANALKHGFCSEVLLVEDPQAVRDRVGEIAPATLPVEGFDVWAAEQAAVLSLRIERCQASEQAIRDRIVARAEVTWDEDRKLEATLLGATIGKKPEAIAARLLETYHGCEWLIGRWSLLANAALTNGCWTPEQSKLAFDMLGTPLEFREGNWPGASIDAQGKVVNPSETELPFARRQIARLQERKELLRPLDQASRERAKADLAGENDPELRRLRRYENALQRRLEWSMDLLQSMSTTPPTPPDPQPQTDPTDADQSTLKAIPPVESATISPIRASARAERKLMKAEARREARRRKLESCRN